MPASVDLDRDLRGWFAQGLAAPRDDAAFSALALRVFAAQYDALAPYRDYCQRRGALPTRLRHYGEIPAVPVQAFRDVRLWSEPSEPPAAVFRTSGTTTSGTRPGEHYMSAEGLARYEASLLPTFRAFVLPDVAEGERSALAPLILGTEAPHSSLWHMVSVACRELFARAPAWFSPADWAAFQKALGEGAACVMTTDLALDAWLEGAEAHGFSVRLPQGSRVLHTGGAKGRKRTIPTDRLYERLQNVLGVPASHLVNEYGMTELSSQFYDGVLRAGADEKTPRRKHGAPWVRTCVVDAQTLDPVPLGTPGLLRIFDLANLGSVMAIQTEDRAIAFDDGTFQLLGRAEGSEPRGCSLDAEAALA